MARRKREEDATNPDHGEGEVMAAVDYHDALASGQANAQPADDPVEETPEVAAPLKRRDGIPYRVFAKISGLKWDQMAGFGSYAKKHNLGPMTVPEWREQLQKFLGKPTK